MTMRYGYKCFQCGPLDSDKRADFIFCINCGERARRDWKFKVDKSFEAHYSPAFGTVVESPRHARDLAKAASAEAYLRTGIEADYQVVEVFDDEAFGINKEEKEFYAAQTRQRLVQDAATTGAELAKAEAARDAKRAEKSESVDA